MSEQNELIKRRLEELEEIIAKGINPYPHRFDVTADSASLIKNYKDAESDEEKEASKNEKVSVAGRIMAIRKMVRQHFFISKTAQAEFRYT